MVFVCLIYVSFCPPLSELHQIVLSNHNKFIKWSSKLVGKIPIKADTINISLFRLTWGSPLLFAWSMIRLFFFFFVWIISVVRSWPGFWQEMDSRWINKSQKQTSNDSWKNEIRHHVIFCSIRLVKTRKSELLIQCYCLEFCVKRNKFLVFFRDAWKGPIFFQHNRVFQRSIGDPLTFHSHPHVKESTFQLCRLRS